MLKLGVTGTIGSGKSAALAALAERGFGTLEADALAREELRSSEVSGAAAQRWGPEVLGKDGTPDRAAIARIVFGDPSELAWLEEQIHPRVRARWQEAVASEPGRAWAVEIPLLFEKKLESLFDFTVSVDCFLEVRLSRLGRRGLSKKQARSRMEIQWSAERKNAAADYVLTNASTLAFLNDQVALLAQELLPDQPGTSPSVTHNSRIE